MDSSLSPDAPDCFSVLVPMAPLEPELFPEAVDVDVMLPSVDVDADVDGWTMGVVAVDVDADVDGWTMGVAEVDVELTVDVVVPALTWEVDDITFTLGVPIMLVVTSVEEGTLNPVINIEDGMLVSNRVVGIDAALAPVLKTEDGILVPTIVVGALIPVLNIDDEILVPTMVVGALAPVLITEDGALVPTIVVGALVPVLTVEEILVPTVVLATDDVTVG